MYICKNCGKKYDKKLSFCGKCGFSLTNDSTQDASSENTDSAPNSAFQIQFPPLLPALLPACEDAETNPAVYKSIPYSPKRNTSSVIMGIISLVLGAVSAQGMIYILLASLINFPPQAVLPALLPSIIVYGSPAVVSVILSRKAIRGGFCGKVSKIASVFGWSAIVGIAFSITVLIIAVAILY